MKRHVTLRKRRRGQKKLPKAAPVVTKAAPPTPKPFLRELLERGKIFADRTLGKALDAIEKDPEDVVRKAERAADSARRIVVATSDLSKWARENPEEASRQLRDALLRGLAQAAKKGKTGGA